MKVNGLDSEPYLCISGVLASGRALPPALVHVNEFAGMGWVLREWGAEAIVFAGSGRQEHLRAAIQQSCAAIEALYRVRAPLADRYLAALSALQAKGLGTHRSATGESEPACSRQGTASGARHGPHE